MTTIVDRGHEKDGSDFASRRRFRERFKKYAKKAVDTAIGKGNITDIGKNGVDVTIPKGDLKQPSIHHGPGGVQKHVIPGNKKYHTGHREPRQKNGTGQGKGPGQGVSDDGEGNDDFTFHLSEEEFLNYLFEDLELPNMEQKNQADLEQMQYKRAGHVSSGSFNKLDLPRSRHKKIGRTIAAAKGINQDIIALLEEELGILSVYSDSKLLKSDLAPSVEWQSSKLRIKTLEAKLGLLRAFADAATAKEKERLFKISEEVGILKKKLGLIPSWNESTDLRYRNNVRQPKPNSRAVMICKMDVSGSVTEEQKSHAKIFYFLLYRFLKRKYDRTDIVFIRYHSIAKEVNEQEFFYGTDTGGTIVSNAAQLSLDIIKERYPKADWNLYLAHTSDGDNSSRDVGKTENLLEQLVKISQASFYVEMAQGGTQELWDTYKSLERKYKGKCFAGLVRERKDIWPLFRKFFGKEVTLGASGSALSFLSPK